MHLQGVNRQNTVCSIHIINVANNGSVWHRGPVVYNIFLGEGRLLLDDVVKAGVFLLIYRKLQNYIVITWHIYCLIFVCIEFTKLEKRV